LGHQVLLPKGAAYDAIVNEFGDAILDDEGMIDRRKLAAIVFNDPEKLKKLSGLVHPAVAGLQEESIAEIARTDPAGIVVVEAAILVETGSYVKFDRLIVVVCTAEQQVQRALHRGSYSKEEAMARIERQLPLEEKRRVADYVIDTSGAK